MSSIPPHLSALERGELAFLTNLVRDRPATRAASGIAGHLCRRSGIGQPTEHRGQLAYTDADFERARKAIERLQTDEAPPEGRPSRNRTAALSSARIAFLALNSESRQPHGHRFDFSSVRLDAARCWDAQILLVTQTLEQLEQAGDLAWLQERLQGHSCMAVCAGATALFPKGAVTSLLQDTQAAIWALCDYTPSGLAWAASLPRLDALALPAEDALRQLVAKTPMPGFLAMLRKHARTLACEERDLLRQPFIQMQVLGGGVLALDFPTASGG